MKLKNAIFAASFIGMAAAANAAVITWSAGTDITGASDITTDGDFVLGHNYGSTGTTASDPGGNAGTFTVNTVVFTQTAIPFTTNPGGSWGPQTNGDIYQGAADANLHGVLDSNVWGNGTPAVITLTGLTANTEYLIQVLAGDERAGGRAAQIANGDGTGVQTGTAQTSTSFIGTFTTGAAETSVDFRAYAVGGDQGVSVSGVQVRLIPEPSSTALLGLGGLALILRRRK